MLHKRLLYASQRRGMRELDLILGPFAEANLEGFCEDELQAYQQMLEYPEVVLYDWLVRGIPVSSTEPENVQQMAQRILRYFGN
jgi:antitoxin CptB